MAEGWDCDDVFAYTTTKTVRILDYRLGCCQYLLMLCILFYVFIYQVVLDLGYLEFEDAENTIRIILQEPTQDNCNPSDFGCKTKLTPLHELGYCCSLLAGRNCSNFTNGSCSCDGRPSPSQNCTYMDGQTAAVISSKGVMITTAVQRFEQSLNEACFLNKSIGEDTCWQIWAPDSANMYYLADIENYSIILDHTVILSGGRALRSKGRDLEGGYLAFSNETDPIHKLMCSGNVSGTEPKDSDFHGQNTTKAPCFLKPLKWNGNDYFPLHWIFKAAGLNLSLPADAENDFDMRRAGAIINMRIVYSNYIKGISSFSRGTLPGRTSFRYTYKPQLLDGANYQEDTILQGSRTQRIVEARYGVLINIRAGGQIATFSPSSLLVTMTTSLTLMAMATVGVNMLAQYFLKKKQYYAKALVEKTIDFSEVDAVNAKMMSSQDEEKQKLYKAMDELCVPKPDEEEGDGPSKAKAVIRLLEKGYDPSKGDGGVSQLLATPRASPKSRSG